MELKENQSKFLFLFELSIFLETFQGERNDVESARSRSNWVEEPGQRDRSWLGEFKGEAQQYDDAHLEGLKRGQYFYLFRKI